MGGEVAEVTQYATAERQLNFTEYSIHRPMHDPALSGRAHRQVTSCIECVQPYIFNISLIGTHGTIKNNQIFSKTSIPGRRRGRGVPTILPDSGDVTHHPFSEPGVALIDCIRRCRSHANIADAFKSHELCCRQISPAWKGSPWRCRWPDARRASRLRYP